jgi:hypothetical protein
MKMFKKNLYMYFKMNFFSSFFYEILFQKDSGKRNLIYTHYFYRSDDDGNNGTLIEFTS